MSDDAATLPPPSILMATLPPREYGVIAAYAYALLRFFRLYFSPKMPQDMPRRFGLFFFFAEDFQLFTPDDFRAFIHTLYAMLRYIAATPCRYSLMP